MAGVTRKPHKEGCLCAICKVKRAKAEREAVVPVAVAPAKPLEVQVGSLGSGAPFELGGVRCRVGDKTENAVVIDKFEFIHDSGKTYPIFKERLTIDRKTMVKPI